MLRSITRLITRLIALAIVAAVAGPVAGTAERADAWQYAGSAGRVGSVVATVPVQVADISSQYSTQLTFLTANGPLVSRIPGTTNPQDVSVLYSIQKWNGVKFVQITARSGRVRIPAGATRARVPNLYVQPTNSSAGYYRVVEMFQWHRVRDGSLLGARFVVPHLASDHVCITRSRLCAASAGSVRVGRLKMLGGGWS